MINHSNILRQITDVQIQADRLLKRGSNLNEIEDFGKYSNELKAFLLNNIEDDFITKHVNQIPYFNLDDTTRSFTIIQTALSWFDFGLGIYSRERLKVEKALKTVRDIKGKFASIDFMLKNYFS